MQKLRYLNVVLGAFIGMSIFGYLLSIDSQAFAHSTDSRVLTNSSDFVDDFVSVSSGIKHSCGLTNAGVVYCWGANTYGQLGNGTLIDSSSPVSVVMPAGVIFRSIDVGVDYSCALTTIGNAYCWGDNTASQLGDRTATTRNSPTAVVMPDGVTFDSLSSGGFLTCATSTAITAYCWGVIKTGSSRDDIIRYTIPSLVSLPTGSNAIKSIDAGIAHFCLISSIDIVYCGGYNSHGQLGFGSSDDWSPLRAINISGEVVFMDVTAGNTHTCGVTTNSKIYCWGSNEYGQLGNGTWLDSNSPQQIYADSRLSFTSVTLGVQHSCALDTNKTAYCWGNNAFGQLGKHTAMHSSIPSPLLIPEGTAITVSSGGNHTCATTTSGKAYCWGDNSDGQLGDGTRVSNLYGAIVGASLIPAGSTTRTPTFSPTSIPSTSYLRSFTDVSNGDSSACALSASGIVYCWGSNRSGQLGSANTPSSTFPVPVQMPSGITITKIFANESFCALTLTSEVYCWGRGSTPIPVRIEMPEGATVIDVATGKTHTCVLITGGSALCWGSNTYGEMGNGTSDESTGTVSSNPTPVHVNMPPGIQFIQISAGNRNTCAVSVHGSVYCWGRNDLGQIGNGITNIEIPFGVTNPTQISMPTGVTFTKIDVGDSFACARTNLAKLYCWGSNSWNQLGTAIPTGESALPAEVTAFGAKAITDFDVGANHVCVLTTDSNTYCWGSSEDGQLGAAPGSMDAVLVAQPTGDTFIKLSLSLMNSCAVTSSGTAYCWGSNMYGQLGNGNTVNSFLPQLVGGTQALPESATPTITATHTVTASRTATPTKSLTKTAIKSATKTVIRTATRTRTRTVTPSPKKDKTPTATKSPTRKIVSTRTEALPKTPTRTK